MRQRASEIVEAPKYLTATNVIRIYYTQSVCVKNQTKNKTHRSKSLRNRFKNDKYLSLKLYDSRETLNEISDLNSHSHSRKRACDIYFVFNVCDPRLTQTDAQSNLSKYAHTHSPREGERERTGKNQMNESEKSAQNWNHFYFMTIKDQIIYQAFILIAKSDGFMECPN